MNCIIRLTEHDIWKIVSALEIVQITRAGKVTTYVGRIKQNFLTIQVDENILYHSFVIRINNRAVSEVKVYRANEFYTEIAGRLLYFRTQEFERLKIDIERCLFGKE